MIVFSVTYRSGEIAHGILFRHRWLADEWARRKGLEVETENGDEADAPDTIATLMNDDETRAWCGRVGIEWKET